ncbi:hypothetical protein [Tsukamurella pseudospumae]|uniref:GerMN domain-containing protein n=1 Tax=Tsukamurella pseudospumae TaxID=239498 RepID=A0A137ZCG0_9ACTN|nr:hypothetical protein [Tsukamurella pseudospumae]KXO95883.1 hypothetical protein AXK61_04305 [Tsukamurella pseudospumae]
MRRSLIAAAAVAVAGLGITACGTGTTVTKYPVSGTLVALPQCAGDDFIVFNDGVGPAIKRAGQSLAELARPVNFSGAFSAEESATGRLGLTIEMCGPGADQDATRDGASTLARTFARTEGLKDKLGSLLIINSDKGIRIVASPFDAQRFGSDAPLTDLRALWRDSPKEN